MVWRMGRRGLLALLANLILVGLIIVGFGLDWRAMLWAEPFSDPVPPAHTQILRPVP
jgi:hypothetical protein